MLAERDSQISAEQNSGHHLFGEMFIKRCDFNDCSVTPSHTFLVLVIPVNSYIEQIMRGEVPLS